MASIPLFHKIIIVAFPIIFAITVHEVAHGWVASKLGDPTARMLGRLSLNPVKHIDPIGTVILPIVMIIMTPFVFGWAKPVPVDWRNLRNPRRDMALVAAAGPGANVLMLIFWVGFLFVLKNVSFSSDYISLLLFEMGRVGVLINVVLIVLNMMPLPPLDGSRIAVAFMSPAIALKYQQLERWGLVILVALLFTGILGQILGPLVGVILQGVDIILAG